MGILYDWGQLFGGSVCSIHISSYSYRSSCLSSISSNKDDVDVHCCLSLLDHACILPSFHFVYGAGIPVHNNPLLFESINFSYVVLAQSSVF